MKNNFTLRTWLSIVIGGIWEFIRNIFSWKNKTPFWRIIWITNTVCVLTIISMFFAAWYKESRYRAYRCSTEYTLLEEDTVVELIDAVEEEITIEEYNNQ